MSNLADITRVTEYPGFQRSLCIEIPTDFLDKDLSFGEMTFDFTPYVTQISQKIA